MRRLWLVAVGLVVALAFPVAAHAYGPGGSGTGFTLSISQSVVKPGDTISVSVATGPCRAGGPVAINIVRPVNQSAPIAVGSTTANASGGIPTTSVVVPASAPFGNYVIYGQCTDATTGGVDIITAALVVDPPPVAGSQPATAAQSGTAAGQPAAATQPATASYPSPSAARAAARAAATWSPPANWATAPVRKAVTAAVRQTLAQGQTGSSSAAAVRPASSARRAVAHPRVAASGSSEGAWITVIVAVGLVGLAGAATLRRRHRTVG